MSAEFSHTDFVSALDRARDVKGLSWNQVATEAGLEPSTLYRIVAGAQPDLARFAALVDWMGLPTEIFFTRSGGIRVTIADSSGPLAYVPVPEGVIFTAQELAHFQRAAQSLMALMLRAGPRAMPAEPE